MPETNITRRNLELRTAAKATSKARTSKSPAGSSVSACTAVAGTNCLMLASTDPAQDEVHAHNKCWVHGLAPDTTRPHAVFKSSGMQNQALQMGVSNQWKPTALP
jgi:hypothetical protein